MELFIAEVAWLIIAFLIGSVPFGLLLAKGFKDIDPREHGSGNSGATNVARVCGTYYGALTFILDVAKGFIPMLVALAISKSAIFLSLSALALLLGHMYSVFLNRKGGKGVATAIGIFAAVLPGPLFFSLVLCILLIWASGYVSLGSLALVSSMPIFALLSANFSYLILTLIIMGLVFHKHRENIERLVKGEENTWRKSKQDSGGGTNFEKNMPKTH